MSSKVKYKGITIAELNTNTSKTLKTSGTYCEADIVVENTQDGGITPSGTKEITDNGTYDVTEYASANVNVPKGITPSGQIEITENGTFDVTNYASALVDVSGGGSDEILFETGTFTLYEDIVCAKSDGHTIYAIEHHLGRTPWGFNLFIENAVNVAQGSINNVHMGVQPWYARNINNPLVWCYNSVYRTNGDSGAYASTNLSTNCAFPISETDKANQMVYADENNIYIGNKNSPNTYQYILRAGNTYRWIAWSPKE